MYSKTVQIVGLKVIKVADIIISKQHAASKKKVGYTAHPESVCFD